MSRGQRRGRREGGLELISSLLLLVVVTILAVGLFQNFGIQEKIAGNLREKQRALAAAEAAQEYAEWWLAQGNGSTGITCSTTVTAPTGQVCSNALTSYTTLPWQISNKPVGVYYTPNTPTAMTFQAANPVPGSYYQTPIFYITYLGLSPNGLGAIYQVDGAGYGGTASAAAVVESTYMVQAAVKDLGVQ